MRFAFQKATVQSKTGFFSVHGSAEAPPSIVLKDIRRCTLISTQTNKERERKKERERTNSQTSRLEN
jgi:hypothetical protein